MATGRAASVARRTKAKSSSGSSSSSSSSNSSNLETKLNKDGETLYKSLSGNSWTKTPQVAGSSTGGSSGASTALTDLSKGLAPAEGDITQEDASGMSLQDLSKGLYHQYAGKTGQTVMSNANLVERVIPLLNQSANNLTGTQGDINYGGGDSYDNTEEGDSFDEIIGLKDKKKKKKSLEEQIGDFGAEDPYLGVQFQLMDRIAQSQDRATREYIKRTKDTFNRRQQEQQQSNESGLAGVKQALNLGGSSRYAPISSSGIISAKEQQGIQALADLDAQENQLIAEIKQAQADKDYQLMESKLGLINEVRKEKQTAAAELETSTREAEATSAREGMIADMVMQGITNPVEIFQNLQAAGITASLADVTGAVKNLNDVGGSGVFKLDQKQVGQLFGLGLTAPDIKAMQQDLATGASLDDILAGLDPDIQTQARKAFGVELSGRGAVTIGKGAKTETEEAFIRTRLFSKIAPILNKGALSDSDRAIIDSRIEEFRAAGLGEQEILDTIAGLPPEVNSPYNSTFRDIIVSNSDTMEKQTANIGRLSQQLSSGNYEGAMKTVENFAMQEAQKLDKDGYMGTATAQNYVKKAQELSKAISDAEGIIGPLEGTWEQIKGKLGKSKSAKAADVSAKIAVLVAQMRNDLSGTAVTSSEAAFLEPLIPSLSDTMDNFEVKVKNLKGNTLNQYNSTRSTVSLPEVTEEMVVDPKKRLILYSNDIYYNPNGQLDL